MTKNLFRNIYYFFPIQLLLEHLRRHYVITFIWLFLFLYITGGIGFKYGIYTLFLAPEYLGQVNSLSYLIMGFTVGIFIMAFHISTYITSGYQFPVIATLPRPFYRFVLNNFIIPVSFIVTYLFLSVHFQKSSQLFDSGQIILNSLSFLSGVIIFYLFTFGYFFTMNKGFRRLISLSEGKLGQWKLTRPLQKALLQDRQWKKEKAPLHNVGTTRVGLYLHSPIRIRQAPLRLRLSPEETLKVLHRNHTFAVVFSLAIVTGLLAIGIFMDHPLFNIPAASSILLIFTLSLLMYIVFYTLFKEYVLWFFIGIFFLSVILINTGTISREGQAYGLSYQNSSAEVNLTPPDPEQVNRDSMQMTQTLGLWKNKNCNSPSEKPVAVFVHTAGGGLKATLWTYYTLAVADSLSGNRFMDHTILITGASGGMIGAAYLRELQYLKKQTHGNTIFSDSLFTQLSSDMLNPVALHLALKDWFITFQKFSYNKILYRKDRGWALEEKLNQNTGRILDHPVSYYHEPERKAEVPMMMITPTILNNGKLLVISPLPISFISAGDLIPYYGSFIPFREAYQQFQPENLRFTTALRMNASYPVISPVVTLPGTPSLQLTDAGFRDNFGYLTNLRFLHYFRKWLNENTSGILVIHISSINEEPSVIPSAFDFLRPFRSVYQDYFNIQQMNGMLMHEFAEEEIRVPVIFFPLNLDERKERISLSWHLTEREKTRIKTSVLLPDNRQILNSIAEIIKQNKIINHSINPEKLNHE